MSGVTAYLVKRAAQKERVRILYRRALKDTLNWAVHRHLFYPDADDLREKFEANKHEDIETIDRLIADGEASYNKWRHPDPYIVKSSLSSFEHFHGLLVAPSSPETLRRLLGLRLCTTMLKKMLSHCDPLSWKQIKIEVVCS